MPMFFTSGSYTFPASGNFPTWGGDVGLSRVGVGLLAVGNGTQGSFLGSLQGLVYYAMSGANVACKMDGANSLFSMRNIGVIGFTSSATDGNQVPDVAFSRISAGQIGLGTGAAQDSQGTLTLKNLADGGSGIWGLRASPAGGLSLGAASGAIKWSNNNNEGLGSYDLSLTRGGAAGTLAVGNGTAGDFTGTVKCANEIISDANGGTWTKGFSSELLTIAAAATTDTVGNLLPANSVIEAVVCRVTTVIPTAATFSVGDATTAARFATGVQVAATSTSVGLTHVDQTGAAGPKQTSAAKVRITPNLTPGTATGVVRITVFYRTFVAPTS